MDETGYRIKGKLHWLHVASNDRFTYYHQSKHRKALLDEVCGTVVHDQGIWPFGRIKIKNF